MCAPRKKEKSYQKAHKTQKQQDIRSGSDVELLFWHLLLEDKIFHLIDQFSNQ